MDPEITIPDAPALLPAELQQQWKKTWLKEFKQAQIDHPGDEPEQQSTAARMANRLLSPDEPESYEDAIAMPNWQCMQRIEKNGKLWVVTINGKKFSFDIPASAKSAAAAKPVTSSNGNAPDLPAMTKDQLIAHAATRGITLDPSLKKDDMITRSGAAK
jgi:hypothetical protein